VVAGKNKMESPLTPILIAGFVAFLIITALLALKWAPRSGADPYCGENYYWDYRHQICEPFATPPPPLFRYSDSCAIWGSCDGS
jgi:hypothetical protein